MNDLERANSYSTIKRKLVIRRQNPDVSDQTYTFLPLE
jgi:hypothetical protein